MSIGRDDGRGAQNRSDFILGEMHKHARTSPHLEIYVAALQPPVKHLEVNVDAVNLGHDAGWRHYFEVHLLCSTLGEIYNYGPRATKMLDVRA
jgi:hypothetical protein